MATFSTFNDLKYRVPNQKTIDSLQKIIDELQYCDNCVSALKLIKKWNKLSDDISTNCSIIYILYSCHTDNKKYKKDQTKVDEISPLFSDLNSKYAKILVAAPYRNELEKKLGKHLFNMMEASLKAFDEKIIPEMIEENKLSSEYDSIFGSALVEFDGKKMGLSQLGKYLQDSNRDVRKAAAKVYDAWLSENEEKIADIYDKLVHLRDSMAKKLGFKNFIELGYLKLGRTDYNAEMVANYRKQIAEEVVPLCTKLYKKQMKEVGIKNPQYYDYNLHFKDGNPVPAGDRDYLVKEAEKMYSSLGNESKEFFAFMQEHELMDLVAYPGKAPGGYCTYLPKFKAPFIFSNFNGTLGDVNVLTHEGGHALQAYLSAGIKVPEYRSPTLEACEIHSMSMEFFAWPYMDGFFKNDAMKYKYLHLVDSIEFLPYGITIDEFQHWVYENPNASHNERCAKFKEIENKYTPHKKYDDCPTYNKGTYWMRQSHVFGTPFYYIDYTLAQVVAFQFVNEMNKNHDRAWKKYVKLCKMGGKLPFTQLLEANHLRNPFIDGNVKKAISPLKKIIGYFNQ